MITIFFGWIDNIWLAVALSLFVGAFIGAFNGFYTVLKFNPLIATLGTMSIITAAGGLTKSMMLQNSIILVSGEYLMCQYLNHNDCCDVSIMAINVKN